MTKYHFCITKYVMQVKQSYKKLSQITDVLFSTPYAHFLYIRLINSAIIQRVGSENHEWSKRQQERRKQIEFIWIVLVLWKCKHSVNVSRTNVYLTLLYVIYHNISLCHWAGLILTLVSVLYILHQVHKEIQFHKNQN